MEKYRRGRIIKLMRQSLGLTQEQAIMTEDGEIICSVKALSRAENGNGELRDKAYKKLMERFGSAIRKTDLLIATDDMEVFNKKKMLLIAQRARQFEEARIILEDMKKDMDMESPFSQQFYLYNHANIEYLTKKIDEAKYIELLTQAIKYTIKYFDKIDIEKWPYTVAEASILMDIAIAYKRQGDIFKGIEHFNQIITAINQNYIDRKSLAKIKLVICDNLSNYLGNTREYNNAINLDTETITFSKFVNNFAKIPCLLYDILWNKNQLQIESFQKNTTFFKEKSYLLKAYYIALSMNDTTNMVFLRDKIKLIYQQEMDLLLDPY